MQPWAGPHRGIGPSSLRRRPPAAPWPRVSRARRASGEPAGRRLRRRASNPAPSPAPNPRLSPSPDASCAAGRRASRALTSSPASTPTPNPAARPSGFATAQPARSAMTARFARAARRRRARGAPPAAARVQPGAESLTLPIARRLLRRRAPRFARPRGRPRRRALSASASRRCPSSTTRAARPSGFVRPDILRPRTPPTARQKSTPPPTAFMRMQTGHPPTHIDCGRQSPTAATFSRNDHSRAAGRTAWANRNLVAAQAACEAKGARSSRGAPTAHDSDPFTTDKPERRLVRATASPANRSNAAAASKRQTRPTRNPLAS